MHHCNDGGGHLGHLLGHFPCFQSQSNSTTTLHDWHILCYQCNACAQMEALPPIPFAHPGSLLILHCHGKGGYFPPTTTQQCVEGGGHPSTPTHLTIPSVRGGVHPSTPTQLTIPSVWGGPSMVIPLCTWWLREEGFECFLFPRDGGSWHPITRV